MLPLEIRLGRLKWVLGLFIGLTVTFALLDVVLFHQNRKLAALASAHIRPLQLLPGVRVPPLAGFDIADKRLILQYGQGQPPLLLLIFSPSCKACDLNWPYWVKILRVAKSRSVRVVLADPGSPTTAAFARKHDIAAFPVLSVVDPNDVIEYSMSLTPQTVLISSEGRVKRIWVGVLGSQGVKQVARTLGAFATR